MHDIRIPDQKSENPRKTDFEVTHVSPAEAKNAEPGEKVKVKFEKFVQLVATHDFEGVMKAHAHEDIIVSTNLLTDLANAHEEAGDHNKKMPIVLIIGVLIGVVVTYLIIRFL